MSAQQGMTVKFWGVRGTIPTPGANFSVGGNTSCVELRCGGRRLILDAGSGVYALGQSLPDPRIDILFSHTHLDHVLGLPFFMPLFKKGREVHFWTGNLQPELTFKQLLGQYMAPPLLPHGTRQFRADVHYHDHRAGEEIDPAYWSGFGIRIRTILLNHPDRSTGYRIEYGGHSLCYITDMEHTEGETDPALIEFVKGTDFLIYDSTYDEADFAAHKGWGHSTWQQAVRLAQAAGAKQLALFHHDPNADDTVLSKREQAAKKLFPAALLAREGIETKLF